jgi:hypothetical protein
MDEKSLNTPKKIGVKRFHLAGIVPVASTLKADFKMILPDVLMPLAPDFTIIENAILTAAYAGCETIWVVMETKTIPIFKEKLGEWVRDPICDFGMYYKGKERRIPIVYVPVNPNDFLKRESLPWSIVMGVNTAYKVTKNLTRWVTPDCYFISFPFGVVDHKIIRENRRKISSKNRFYCSYQGKTVKDGEYLPFTFFLKDFIRYKNYFKDNEVMKYDTMNFSIYGKENWKLIPLKERYTGRYFNIKDIFSIAEITEEDTVVEFPWYFNIDNWEGYCQLLGHEGRKTFKRPSSHIFPPVRYRKWLPMGEDELLKEQEQEAIEKEQENNE